LGLDVVRRPTGGRAVWHQHEVTYAVAAPVTAFGCLRVSYLAIHRRLADALRQLGAAADLAPRPERPASLHAGACFAESVGGEVVVGGSKLIGSAQVRQGVAFLQHGSILLSGSQNVISQVSRQPGPTVRATTLSVALGRPVDFDEVAAAIVETWRREEECVLASSPTAQPPSHPIAFNNPAWTWRR